MNTRYPRAFVAHSYREDKWDYIQVNIDILSNFKKYPSNLILNLNCG